MFQRWPGRIGGLLTALACACLCAGPAWSQAALVPNAIQQFFDANGNPLSSGFVYFYVPGTTSPKTVWQDAGQTIPYANPIQLNAAGEPNTAAGIWGAGNYRQIVQDQLQNLIWDAVTATPGTSSGGGGTSGDGMPIGFIMAYAGPAAPTGYDFAYGQNYSRTGFPTLLGALTITENGTCTNGSGNITALADTSQMGVGQAIESTCLPPGTTISAILSSSSISVNALATGISGTYSLQVFPFGNGNGATTFQLPDLRGYGLAGRDNMGGTAANILTSATRANGWDLLGAVGGVEALTLATSQLPAHSHEILVADPGHFHVFTYSTSAAGSGGAAQTTNIDAFGDATLTNTQAQATGITATAASAGGGVATAATLGAPTSQALASGTVSFGGGSYTNGASVSLTVTGGTCATQPVILATVSGNKVTAINSVSTPGACVVPPTNPATLSDGTHVSATIVGVYGDGSGYTTGSQVLTVLGGTCTTQPQFTVTVAGGSVTTVNSLTTAGLCTVPPVNPAATSGGGGTGATLAVTYSTRPTAIVQPTIAINYVIKVNTNSGAFTIPIANNTVVGNNSGFTNPPTAITAPSVLAMICNTRGALLENSALGWSCTAPGTNGYVWTSNGAGADPSYQPVTGAGGAVSGPATDVVGNLSCWANAFGTVLKDCLLGVPNGSIHDVRSVAGIAADFWTTYYGNPGSVTDPVHRLDRWFAGPATVASSDVTAPNNEPTVQSWLDTLLGFGVTSFSQGVALSAVGALALTGGSRCSDFRTVFGASSQGCQGGTYYAVNDDPTGAAIACGVCGTGIMTASALGDTVNQFDIMSAHTPVVIEPGTATIPNGSTIAALLTPGVIPALATQNVSAGWVVAGTGKKFNKGGVCLTGALDASVGAGGAGACIDMFRGQSVRWRNAMPATDAEIWGDAGGLHSSAAVNAPSMVLDGSGSGAISILPQAAAGTYNFNLPTTAGTSGYVLTSAGGVAAPMTWQNLASTYAPLASPTFTGTVTVTGGFSVDPSGDAFGSSAAFTNYLTNTTHLLITSTAPTIGSCGGGTPSIPLNNGTASYRVSVGSATSTCVVNMPTASNGWNCHADDITTTSTTVFYTKQIGSSISSVTFGNFNDTAGAANWSTSDVLAVSCFAL